MSGTTGQRSLATLIARTSTIALIAMVMPLGVDISGDGVVSFGASISHAASEGNGNGHGGRGNGGGHGGGDHGGGNGGEAGSGDGEGDGSSGDDGGSGGGGSSGSPGAGNNSSSDAPGPSASAPAGGFGESAEPASADLTEQEEQDLISRGWQ